MEHRTWNIEHRIILLFILVFVATKATAGDTGLSGFDRQIFKPAADQSGIYNVVGTEIPKQWQIRTGFVTNFGKDPTTVVVPATGRRVEILDWFWGGDFLVSTGYWDHWSFGLALPVLFYEDGTNFNSLQSYSAASFGDLRLDVKYRFIKETENFPALAVFSQLSFPTGLQERFTGERGVTWNYRLAGEKMFYVLGSKFYVLGNVGFKLRKEVTVLASRYGDTFTFGVGSRYQLPWQNKTWSVETELAGESYFTNTRDSGVPLEMRVGIRKNVLRSKFYVLSSKEGEHRTWNIERRTSVYFGIGRGLTSAVGSPQFRIFGGLAWNF